MIHILNIIYKLTKILFFKKININKWYYTFDNPVKNSTNWSKLNDNKIKIDIDKNKVWFRPSKKLKSKWYILTLYHLDLNKFAYINFRNGEYGYSQGRLASNGKKRSRVIKNNKDKDLIICISNLSSKLRIQELSLIPIPAFYAWVKIQSRLNDFKERLDGSVKDKKMIWKIYNKALSQTASLNKVVSYKNWIEKVENNLINKRDKYYDDYSKYFKLKSIDKIDFEYNSDWVIPIKDNYLIPNFAYYYFYESISSNKNCLILYSDEDYIDKYGERYNPNFKSSWNRELFLSNLDFGKAWVINAKIWNKAIEQAIKNHNTRDFKIVLLICIYLCDLDNSNNKNIYHLPIIGLHKKDENNNKQNYIDNEYKRFLYNFIDKKWKNLGKISSIEINNYRTGLKLSWSVPKSSLLSIIIPTKDKLNLLEGCINSILNTNSGLKFEIIVIDNNSNENRTHNYYKKIQNRSLKNIVKIIKYKKSFNFSKINNFAYKFAKGDVLLFLNNDIEFICNNWALELYSNAIRPQIGCVGAKLIYPNETIQHAGVAIGISGTAGHLHKYFGKDDNGYQNRINLMQQLSAVTGACMAIKKSRFKEIGMFDEILFKVNFNDVDLCLKLMKHGYKNLYVPDVLAIHHESATRSTTKGFKSLNNEYEKISLKNKWNKIINNDPFYSPYLTLINEDLSLSYRKLKIKAR